MSNNPCDGDNSKYLKAMSNPTPSPKDVKRYHEGWESTNMEESEVGSWVKYEDHAEALAEERKARLSLESKAKGLVEALEPIRKGGYGGASHIVQQALSAFKEGV